MHSGDQREGFKLFRKLTIERVYLNFGGLGPFLGSILWESGTGSWLCHTSIRCACGQSGSILWESGMGSWLCHISVRCACGQSVHGGTSLTPKDKVGSWAYFIEILGQARCQFFIHSLLRLFHHSLLRMRIDFANELPNINPLSDTTSPLKASLSKAMWTFGSRSFWNHAVR